MNTTTNVAGIPAVPASSRRVLFPLVQVRVSWYHKFSCTLPEEVVRGLVRPVGTAKHRFEQRLTNFEITSLWDRFKDKERAKPAKRRDS